MANTLEACIYCKGEQPRNRAMRKRLRDTWQNRARELAIYRFLSTTGVTGKPTSR